MGYTEHRATARVLAILTLLKQEAYTLSGLARKLEAPKGSIHPILQTMRAEHFVTYSEKTGEYQMGPMAFQVGMSFVNRGESIGYIEAQLERMVSQCLETVHFAILDRGSVVYLVKKESPQAVRMIASIGKSLPAYATAIGKALLLDMTPEELKKLYPEGLHPMTKHTITEFDTLICQLQEYSREDITYECGESTPDVRCIGCAIRRNGAIIAAVSIAAPIFRSSEKTMEAYKEILLETKKDLEEYLSYRTLF